MTLFAGIHLSNNTINTVILKPDKTLIGKHSKHSLDEAVSDLAGKVCRVSIGLGSDFSNIDTIYCKKRLAPTEYKQLIAQTINPTINYYQYDIGYCQQKGQCLIVASVKKSLISQLHTLFKSRKVTLTHIEPEIIAIIHLLPDSHTSQALLKADGNLYHIKNHACCACQLVEDFRSLPLNAEIPLWLTDSTLTVKHALSRPLLSLTKPCKHESFISAYASALRSIP